MKNWQKLAVGLGIIGIGYNFIVRYETLPYYQLISIAVGVFYIIKQFRK
jgi:hypothetical protein